MKFNSKAILENMLPLLKSLRGNYIGQKPTSDESPLRAELFTSDQMKQHGKALADAHKVGFGKAPHQLLKRLAENEDVLNGACNLLTASVTANRRITPAGDHGCSSTSI